MKTAVKLKGVAYQFKQANRRKMQPPFWDAFVIHFDINEDGFYQQCFGIMSETRLVPYPILPGGIRLLNGKYRYEPCINEIYEVSMQQADCVDCWTDCCVENRIK